MNIQLHRRFAGHEGSVYALTRSSSKQFISAGSDGVIAEWNAEETDEGTMLARVPGIVYSLCALPGKNMLLCGTAAGGIHVIDLEEKKEKRLLQFHNAPVFSMYYLASHQLLFSLAGNGVLHIADSETLSPVKRIQISRGKLRSLAVCPGGKSIVIGTAEGFIHLLSLPDLEEEHHWLAHKHGFSVNTLCYSPDGSRLLSGSRDACINITDAKDFTLHQSVAAHNYAIYSIAFRPGDDSVFATASRDKTVKLWNSETLEVIARLDRDKYEGHINSVNNLVWLNESTLVSAGDDRTAIAWKLS